MIQFEYSADLVIAVSYTIWELSQGQGIASTIGIPLTYATSANLISLGVHATAWLLHTDMMRSWSMPAAHMADASHARQLDLLATNIPL